MFWKKVYLLEAANRFSLGQYVMVEKEIIGSQYCRLVFHAPPVTGEAKPGQFVMVYPPDPGAGKMLPRPFSVFAADKKTGQLAVFFRIVGKGTAMLSRLEPGVKLQLLGPLGTGFPAPPAGSLLVAGGIGIAPLAFLAASVNVKLDLIYGAATGEELSCPPEYISRRGLLIHEATEDGSRGKQGSVVDLFRSLLPRAKAIFACGTRPMLEIIACQCLEEAVPAWVSLEERMACGIGACRGCAVMTKSGYRRVCSDGPVFPVGEVFAGD